MRGRRTLFACLLAALVAGGAMLVPLASTVTFASPGPDTAYRLDAGDKLRVVVYGQEGLTNSYTVDAGGAIAMPLIGAVRARGLTLAQLSAAITARLKKGYLREPYVAVEVEAYRPFFILGEVAAPGQYPYVPNMSVEAAVAIAGGFTPRAQRGSVALTRNSAGASARYEVPLGTPLQPGDTIVVGERWF
jgi:polysaccharide export outer membrane protein